MEAKFSELRQQFDKYIQEVKNTKEYSDYQYAKDALKNCEQATYILNQIKELQQAKHSCKVNGEGILVNEIENELENFNNKYDMLLEVVQFNIAYDNLVNLVSKIKDSIENHLH